MIPNQAISICQSQIKSNSTILEFYLKVSKEALKTVFIKY